MTSFFATIPVISVLEVGPDSVTSGGKITVSAAVSETQATVYQVAAASGTVYAGEEALRYD